MGTAVQASLNKWVLCLREFQHTIIIHQPFTIPSSFKEVVAKTLVVKQTHTYQFMGDRPV